MSRRSPHARQPATPELSLARSDLGRTLLALQGSGSSSQRLIADYLLRNSVTTAAAGIDELAQRIGTSTATLSRFARAAGFEHFAQLKAALAESVQAVLAPVQKLALSQASAGGAMVPGAPQGAPDEAVFAATQINVQQAARSLSAQQLQHVARAITRARTVYTVGFGLSSHLAALLALNLQPFCEQLINVVEFGGSEVAAGRMMNVGPNDVVVVISVPRYASDAINLANYARARGATLVALTDSPASPLATIAEHVLYAPAQHPVLSSSLVAPLAVIEALVSIVMLASPNSVEQAARLTDAISDYMYGGNALKPQRLTLGPQPAAAGALRARKGKPRE